jgi:nicotinamide-nucleotide amidase
MFDEEVLSAARQLLDLCRAKALHITTAESCTGGLVAAALTEIAGSSDVFDRGFVTYSDAAKVQLLGVSVSLIARDGAVSETVARAMAEGALQRSDAELAIAVTGVAGPGGGSVEKPVGLVHFACAAVDHHTRHMERRFGDVGRGEVRRLAVLAGLTLLRDAAKLAAQRKA